MTEICYPATTDWSCAYTEDELGVMWNDHHVANQMRRSEALAWMSLAHLTADQLGTCPITVRPCNQACAAAGTYLVAPVSTSGHFAGVLPGRWGFAPFVNGQGAWVNSCMCPSGDCSCSSLSEAILPGPVGSIEEVWLDGAVLDSSAYRVDNGNRLVRTDGGSWPSCQNMAQDAHGDEAFSVTYYQGAAPDPLSGWIAGLLAVEYFKACKSDKSCRLPNRLQSVARQGVTYQIKFEDDDGTTGIREVDDYVRRLNPWHLKMAPVIVTPQTRRPRQTTWSR